MSGRYELLFSVLYMLAIMILPMVITLLYFKSKMIWCDKLMKLIILILLVISLILLVINYNNFYLMFFVSNLLGLISLTVIVYITKKIIEVITDISKNIE